MYHVCIISQLPLFPPSIALTGTGLIYTSRHPPLNLFTYVVANYGTVYQILNGMISPASKLKASFSQYFLLVILFAHFAKARSVSRWSG